MNTRIEVVSGIVVRDGRLLLTQRREGKDYPHTWETPGGKVERGETHVEALDRELAEEVALDATTIETEEVIVVDSVEGAAQAGRATGRTYRISFYVVRAVGSARNLEGQGLGWFTEEEMRALPLAPGNVRALEAIAAKVWRDSKCG